MPSDEAGVWQAMATPSALAALEALAREAGAVLMQHFHRGVAVERKADRSPVTAADREAEALIARGLRQLSPWPLVAEEAWTAASAQPTLPTPDDGMPWWLVDPLDGTREFIEGRGEFTVNIALIHRGQPVVGVLHAPAFDVHLDPARDDVLQGHPQPRGSLWLGVAGQGAWAVDGEGHAPRRLTLPAPVAPGGPGPTVLCSRSHDDRQALARALGAQPVARWRPAGSSLKFALLAEGQAQIYPRLGPTMAWDLAAGQALLEAAGGCMRPAGLVDGRLTVAPGTPPLRYDRARLRQPPFLACAGAACGA